MPSVDTKYFGRLPFSEGAVFDFPQGLPAFEDQRTFVLIEVPEAAPLVFLQSVTRASLCFVAFPIQAVDKTYQLAIAPEDLQELGLGTERQPILGSEVTVIALLSTHDECVATANLMAPVVLNTQLQRGMQAIRHDTQYSHVFPLISPEGNVTEEAC